VSRDDFRTFTHIYALDHDNLEGLRAIAPRDATAEIGLLLDLVPGHEGRAVADPYYGDDAGFDVTWRDVVMAAEALARRLASEGWR
jgi:protein-tyrosine phosphatase